MFRTIGFAVCAALVVPMGACSSTRTARVLTPAERLRTVEALRVLDGATGEQITLNEAVHRARAADVVVVGEFHDNPEVHAFQQWLYEQLLEREPNTALCLEMLERDEQAKVDAYLAGTLPLDEFIDSTKSRSWSGQLGSWLAFYQPGIDAAREAGAPVVAANAPRSYVSRAGTEGYDALLALPEDERALFELPIAPDVGAYRHRFAEFMRAMREQETPVPDADVDRVIRSQRMWDATMAGSVVAALDESPKALLFVGSFHSDWIGGTVLELIARRPGTTVFIVSPAAWNGGELADADRGRGDLVVPVHPGLSKD